MSASRGIDIKKAADGALIFSAALFDGASPPAKIIAGTTYVRLWHLVPADGTLAGYDFADNTFKTTALGTATGTATHRTTDNATYNTGVWTYRLATLTGFVSGDQYFVEFANSTATPAAGPPRWFQYGGVEGEALDLTTAGTPVAIDSGAATLVGMLLKMIDDAGGAAFDATLDSQHAIRNTVPLGTAMRGTDGAYTGTPPSAATIAAAVWDALTSAAIITGSFGLKLKNWVLGTDSKALVSTDAQDLSGNLSVNAKTVTDKTGYALTTAPPTVAQIWAIATADATSGGGLGAAWVALNAKFAGITSLAWWLRLLGRKDAADSTAKTEFNSGGGLYDEATDSGQAIRDTTPLGTTMRGTDGAELAGAAMAAVGTLHNAPDVSGDVTDIKTVTAKLDTALALNAGLYRLTAAALALAPVASTTGLALEATLTAMKGSGWAAGDNLKAILAAIPPPAPSISGLATYVQLTAAKDALLVAISSASGAGESAVRVSLRDDSDNLVPAVYIGARAAEGDLTYWAKTQTDGFASFMLDNGDYVFSPASSSDFIWGPDGSGFYEGTVDGGTDFEFDCVRRTPPSPGPGGTCSCYIDQIKPDGSPLGTDQYGRGLGYLRVTNVLTPVYPLPLDEHGAAIVPTAEAGTDQYGRATLSLLTGMVVDLEVGVGDPAHPGKHSTIKAFTVPAGPYWNLADSLED